MKTDGKLFLIGDVAKMFGLSVSSLRHYEKEGLLRPEYIDINTGYRYYGLKQFEVLNTVRYLRVLDMPLKDIREFLNNRDIDVIKEKLSLQRAEVKKRIGELKIIERKIKSRLKTIEDAQSSVPGIITVENRPGIKMAFLEKRIEVKGFTDMEEPLRMLDRKEKQTTVFLGKVGLQITKERLLKGDFNGYDGIFIILDKEEDYSGEAIRLKAQDCCVVRFRGLHADSPAYYEKLVRYINENGFKIDGFSREITMVDYGLTSDETKFLTEIAVPVRKN